MRSQITNGPEGGELMSLFWIVIRQPAEIEAMVIEFLFLVLIVAFVLYLSCYIYIYIYMYVCMYVCMFVYYEE